MLAFVLITEFNGKQCNIAKVLNVSEGTVSLWLKEMRFREKIHSLELELMGARKTAIGLQTLGLLEDRNTFNAFPQS